MKLHLISLGCTKNLVDSEIIAGQTALAGFSYTSNINEADVIILNTCAFISSAKKEAYQYIKKIVSVISSKSLKNSKSQKPIFIVSGCLPQIEKSNLLKKFPQIDFVFGVDQFIKIPTVISSVLKSYRLSNQNKKVFVQQPKYLYSNSVPRIVSTPKSYAYIKIADGCDNRCSYCLIPTIRGQYRERPIEDIVREAEKLVSLGVKELILISQDTTFYGMKIYKQQMLHHLLKKLAQIKDLYWIRILYTNPKHFYPELIKTISETEKVCKYIDIPIQHTNDKILKLMNRTSRKQIFDTIEKLKTYIPNITLRTTIMVGFPTETEKVFNQLLTDITNLEFDWLGCFEYSKEPKTAAAKLNNHIPKKIKSLRFDKVMQTQQKITFKKNMSRVGKIYPTIVDEKNFGHTEFQSPEIDGKIIFEKLNNNSNLVIKTKIVSISKVYDLVAQPL
jgi:ribosomal protein S12 methylthiotransferase